MKKIIDTLRDSVPIIKQLGEKVGREITDEEIARKINLSREQFDRYLNAEATTPNAILTQLWAAFADLIDADQRSNRSVPLKNRIGLVKTLGLAKGMEITDEEIIEKLAIPRVQFENYLRGEIETPQEILSSFRSAWPDLFKYVEDVTITEEMDDDDE